MVFELSPCGFVEFSYFPEIFKYIVLIVEIVAGVNHKEAIHILILKQQNRVTFKRNRVFLLNFVELFFVRNVHLKKLQFPAFYERLELFYFLQKIFDLLNKLFTESLRIENHHYIMFLLNCFGILLICEQAYFDVSFFCNLWGSTLQRGIFSP